MEKSVCPNPKCKAIGTIVKFGKVPTVNSGFKQRYRCQTCAKTFYGEEELKKKEV